MSNGRAHMDDAGVVGLVDAFEYSVEAGTAVALREPRLIQERTSLGETTLHLLVLGDSIEAIQALMKLGANPNSLCYMGETPLTLAASRGWAAALMALLERGARIWVEGQRLPILHHAVRSGNAETVCAVLDAGADVNQQADFGETPAHIAAEENHSEILRLLLSRGADVTIESTFDGTPLDVAREHASEACVEILASRQ